MDKLLSGLYDIINVSWGEADGGGTLYRFVPSAVFFASQLPLSLARGLGEVFGHLLRGAPRSGRTPNGSPHPARKHTTEILKKSEVRVFFYNFFEPYIKKLKKQDTAAFLRRPYTAEKFLSIFRWRT